MHTDAGEQTAADRLVRGMSFVGVWLMLVAVGLASCAPQRPSREEWRGSWQSVQEVVPPAEQLPRPLDHETCSEVLGDLRERAPELTPAPDPIVDDAAQAWVAHAESFFFDCADDEEPAQHIEEGYATLDRLRAEVEAALAASDG